MSNSLVNRFARMYSEADEVGGIGIVIYKDELEFLLKIQNAVSNVQTMLDVPYVELSRESHRNHLKTEVEFLRSTVKNRFELVENSIDFLRSLQT